MKGKKYTINQVLANHSLLENDSWGFDHYECRYCSLQRKSKDLLINLNFLVGNGLLNGDRHYVWFYNDEPVSGRAYDTIRIYRVSDDSYIGGLHPSLIQGDYATYRAKFWIWHSGDNYKSYGFKGWEDMKYQLKENEKLRATVIAAFNNDKTLQPNN